MKKTLIIIGLFFMLIGGQIFAQTEKESIVDYEQLRVLTYNIWNGFDWGKSLDRQAKTVNWIASQKPDVVALQELCGYTEEKLKEDAKKWGHHYSLILKEDGYPVGITSNKPIALVEKVKIGLWHGMLHAKTHGIDFFVVHLSPADRDIRYKEAELINDRILKSEAVDFLVLGDFNAHSPFDGDYDLRDQSLLNRVRKGDVKNEKHNNLLDSEFDYSVMSLFISLPLIDLSQKFIKPSERFTFPAGALIGNWQTAEEVQRNRHRIDYIMASRSMALKCTSSQIFNGKDTDLLSDHYPVMATFKIPAQK